MVCLFVSVLLFFSPNLEIKLTQAMYGQLDPSH